MGKKNRDNESTDIRVEATKVIWALTTAIMGISIPITAITNAHEPVLPILALMVAGVSTLGVWLFGHRNNQSGNNAQLEELNETIHALKNNVAMLEDTLGDELLRRRIESETSAPKGNPAESFMREPAREKV